MSISKPGSFLGRIDPYWYCRLIGLKTVYIATIVFMANMILRPPLAAIVMLIPSVGILIAEMPEINDIRKKDHVYLGYLVVMILTISLFGSYVYLKEWFIVAACTWCFLLYMALRKSPNLFPVVSVFLMLGIITLEGINTGNSIILFNEIIFILEFSIIVFWAHKLFPNYYHKVWLNATLRSIESLISSLDNVDGDDFRPGFKHYLAAKQIIPLLKKKTYREPAGIITDKLSYYQYYLGNILKQGEADREQLTLIRSDLESLYGAVINLRDVRASVANDAVQNENLMAHYKVFKEMGAAWNRLI